jgi:hypothetical protein
MNMSKRIFKSAAILFVMCAMLLSGATWRSVQAGGGPKAKAKPALPISISITITFGRASKGYRGIGICKLTIGKLTSTNARLIEAELSPAGDGKLQLTLVGRAPEEGPTLFIDQDITLTADSAKRLGFRTVTIRRGAYAFGGNKSVLSARLTK